MKKLKDIAQIERAKKGNIYPAGTIAIQISATKGEVIYHDKETEIESKYVAIISNEVNKKYLYTMLKNGIEQFLFKYQNGLNLIAEDIGLFEVEILDEIKQKIISDIYFSLEQEEENIKKEIENLKKMKKRFSKDMFI